MIDLSSSLGAALANHLWQSTLFVGAAWLLSLLLRGYSARLRYAIWLTASVKFLLPFSLLIALGGLLPRPHSVVQAQRAAYSTMDTVGQPFSEAVLSTPGAVFVARQAQAPGISLPLLLVAVWLCGVMVVLTVSWRRWRQVSAAIRLSAPKDVGREATVLRRLDGQRRVELRLSEGPMEPGIFGIFRPKLIWPARLSERLDDEHIEAIMAHELTHVRRLDNLTAALHMLVEAVFWFHPAVWWMERHMVEERERACDEAVVERGGRAAVYAASLLKACRFCVESPVMCVAGISGADLTRRVRSIMTLQARRLGALGTTTLAALAIATIAMPLAFGLVRMIPVAGQLYHPTEPIPSF
jgi:beta-lactamase regulating signal transducer with metallopeptidase domain